MFNELQSYLNQVLTGGSSSTTPASSPVAAPSPVNLSTQIKELLRQMLQLFKQEATAESRQKLQKLCINLSKLAPNESGWQQLVNLAQKAIANPKHSYPTLAPVVIKELKRGSDLIELGQSQLLTPTPELERLANAKLPQILVSLDPQSVANTLMKVFNKQQLSQLLQILETAR